MNRKSSSRTGRTKAAFRCQNRSVSPSLTAEIIDQVRKLPDCPASEYLKDQFLTKYVSKETDPASVRRQRAINKWLSVERDNEATNVRLLITPDDFHIIPGVPYAKFVEKCRSFILSIIGETVPEEALIGSFSGGASTSRKRTESHPGSKYTGGADVTPAARSWFELALELMPGWSTYLDPSSIREVPGNILFTVPKNTEIDRCACKEPDLNMFLQKGVGNFFRHKLYRQGIDLNDQTRNQNLAREGSITGSLATLDLSSASDSVSEGLVRLLLPELWFLLLSDLRSPVTMIDGETHSNEMFSSMGNGFTFELESLLFYSLCRTTAYFRGIKGVISVYGDDLIVPVALSNDIIGILDYFGFSVNPDKSFTSGSFRESCGGHFNNGYDVTPFYIRKPIELLTDLIHIANAIRKWADRGKIGVLDPRVEPLWLYLKSRIPEYLWGGHDVDAIDRLVTTDGPRKRLLPLVRESRLGLGGYLQWLNTTWRREAVREGVETSLMSRTSTKYRLRSANSSGKVVEFLSEL